MLFTKTSNIIVAALLTALPALGQDSGYVYEPFSGSGNSGPDHNWGLFTSAQRSANNTRSVTFPGFQGETWTWRVNVSNVAVPDARPAFPSEQPPFVDPKIVYLTYDFQWPGGGTLNEKINQSETNGNSGQRQQICMTTYDIPVRARYANRYEDSDNGDCAGILGDNCTALLKEALNSGNGNTCQSPDLSPNLFPESCNDRLLPSDEGYTRGSSTQGIGNGTAGNGTAANGRSYNETESGKPVYFRLGGRDFARGGQRGAVNGTNTTLFDTELSHVQMIGLTGFPDGQKRLMCLRVSTEKTSGGNMMRASGVTVLSAVGLAIMSAAFAVL